MSKFQLVILLILGSVALVLVTIAVMLGITTEGVDDAVRVNVYVPNPQNVSAAFDAVNEVSEPQEEQTVESVEDPIMKELSEAVVYEYLDAKGNVVEALSADEMFIISKNLPPSEDISMDNSAVEFLTETTVGRLSAVIIDKFCFKIGIIKRFVDISGDTHGNDKDFYQFTVTPNSTSLDSYFILRLYPDPFTYEITDKEGNLLAAGGPEVVLGDVFVSDYVLTDEWHNIQ